MLATPAFDSLPGISPAVYGKEDFRAVAALIYAKAGIVLPPEKAMLVYSRLAPLVRDSQSDTFGNYLAKIRNDDAECSRAVAALTTNHTFFYREAHHFEHFAATVRPRILADSKAGKPVRLWSAGSSSGEEVWSLVMTLLGPDRGEGRKLANSDIRFLASDIDYKSIETGSRAQYATNDLSPVPQALVSNWTTKQGERSEIIEEARAMVRFRYLNLQGDWPMRGSFDVIFCRNVMIYFDAPVKERLIARFAQALRPGGYLYIGHSERVTGPASQLLQPIGPTIYQKGGAA